MRIQQAVRRQYQAIVDRAATQAAAFRTPPEGWLRTTRKALGMSGAQLARRMGVTRARVAAAEHDELAGGITLKAMRAVAEAMDCRFVYAVIPRRSIEEMVTAQARKKALAIVGAASRQMALEGQMLPDDKIHKEIVGMTADLARNMPPGFWDDN